MTVADAEIVLLLSSMMGVDIRGLIRSLLVWSSRPEPLLDADRLLLRLEAEEEDLLEDRLAVLSPLSRRSLLLLLPPRDMDW